MLPGWRRWLSPEFTSRTAVLCNINMFCENLMTTIKSISFCIHVYLPYINRTRSYWGPDTRMDSSETLRIFNTFHKYIRNDSDALNLWSGQQYVQAMYIMGVTKTRWKHIRPYFGNTSNKYNHHHEVDGCPPSSRAGLGYCGILTNMDNITPDVKQYVIKITNIQKGKYPPAACNIMSKYKYD